MINELLCKLCGTKKLDYTPRQRNGRSSVLPERNPNTPHWGDFREALNAEGLAAALETLPPKVQEWWRLAESGMRHTDIARKTKANRSTVGNSIRRIQNGGVDKNGH